MNETKYPATCTVHTPSGPTNACDEHARQLLALMGMLGAHANITALAEPSSCANCVNEADTKQENEDG